MCRDVRGVLTDIPVTNGRQATDLPCLLVWDSPPLLCTLYILQLSGAVDAPFPLAGRF